MNKEIAEKLARVEVAKERVRRLRELLQDHMNYYRDAVEDLERTKGEKTVQFRYVTGDGAEDLAPVESLKLHIYEGETPPEALARLFNDRPEHFRVVS